MSAYLPLAHGVAAGCQGLPGLLTAHCQQNKRAMGQAVSLVLPKPQMCCSKGLENLARHSTAHDSTFSEGRCSCGSSETPEHWGTVDTCSSDIYSCCSCCYLSPPVADRAPLSDFCLALFFIVCVFYFFLIIKTTKQKPHQV